MRAAQTRDDVRRRRLRLLAAGALLVTLGVLAWLVMSARRGPNPGVLILFGAVLILAENAAMVLPSSLRVSPSFALVMAAISAFDGRGATVGALAVGACAGLVGSHLRRRRFAVVAFNASQYALAAVSAAGCGRLTPPGRSASSPPPRYSRSSTSR
jgi:hypothetical protein